MTKTDMTDVMTIQEVMDELGLSRDTLYRRIRDKQIVPMPKINPLLRIEKLRFRMEDVERLKHHKAAIIRRVV